MLHACATRFDVTENPKNFWKLNMALFSFLDKKSRYCSTFVCI